MAIPRIYRDQPCPLEGYEDFTVRLLVNPTGRELRDWQTGHLGTPGCADCAEARQVTPGAYCAACTEARERKGRSAVVLYGPALLDRPCRTTDEALAILDDDDLPPELFTWLLLLPDRAVNERLDQVLRPNWPGSLTTPST